MAFPRSPTVTAHVAWDLHKASKGRFYLGLGSQVKAHNERRYGLAWSPPAPRMRDYIGAVRAIWDAWESEAALDYHSDTYNLTLMTPNFSPRPAGLPRIPVSLAAVGPAMLRLGGEVCDGVRLHPFSTRRYLAEVSVARIAEGLAKSGRERRNVEVIAGGYGFIGTGPNEEAIAKARAYVRFRIAFYCSTKAYWDVLRLHDLEWLGEKVNPLPRENRWSEMAEQIPGGQDRPVRNARRLRGTACGDREALWRLRRYGVAADRRRRGHRSPGRVRSRNPAHPDAVRGLQSSRQGRLRAAMSSTNGP